MKKQITALYCRIGNSPACDDIATILQKTSLFRYAEERGFQNIEYFEDIGFSGRKMTGRPAFQALQSAIDAGEVQRVVVRSFSRIGRDTTEVVRWITKLHAQDAEVIALDCPAASFEMLRKMFGELDTGAAGDE